MPEPVLIHQTLSRSAERYPENPCLVLPSRTVTYTEVEATANRTGHLLRRLRLERGDRIGILADNSLDYVSAYYGALKVGGVTVPVNPATDSGGLQYAMQNCGARALVTQARFAPVVSPALASTTDLRFLLVDDVSAFGTLPSAVDGIALPEALPAEPDTPPDCPTIDLDLASIIYTSGSTGRPRGAMLTHLNVVSNTRSIVGYLGLSPSDRIMVVLPFHYVYGKSLLNTHVWAGGSLIVGTDLLFPNAVVDRMTRDEATGLSGVPSTFAILLHRSRLADAPPPTLRYVTQAGGAMAPELIRKLMDALPRRRIFIMYGATEASARLTYLRPEDLPRKIGSIGRPIDNVEIRVLREDGSEAAPGEVGELVARGSNIMQGYWSDQEETRSVLGPKGFHTGDLGWRDEEGYLFVKGRTREMIKCGAHRISPKEIEDVLMEHPGVFEVAVIGVPDLVMGESIRAFVVPRDPGRVTEEELHSFCTERLPEFKRPTEIKLRSDLPKSAAGKIEKRVLRREAGWKD